MYRSHELVQRFLKSPVTTHIPNEKLLRLYNTFKLSHSELLPIVKPPHVTQTPFEFHSSFNSNQSYIDSPRLSVTKLLTRSWCELRDYYTVYSGSIKEPKGKALVLGTQYHEELEADTFDAINIAEFENVLKELFAGVEMGTYSQRPLRHMDGDDTVNMDASEDLDSFVDSESALASEWMESGMFRLYNLLLKSETRELLVHNYLDFDSASLQMTPESVLVSGVIDYLQLLNIKQPDDYSMFEEIQALVDLNPNHVLDLSHFFVAVDDITADYMDDYKLKITDVKTRRTNFVPAQPSVLKASYLQVCFYKQFFGALASDPLVSYQMICRNASVRNQDLDKPISPIVLFVLLRKYPELLLNDFTNIANGDAIGFEPYDSHTSTNSDDSYDFTNLFNEAHFKYLKEVDEFDYSMILNHLILKKWHKPLTLRYFAARTAQFYNLFKKFESDMVSIEYHNINTKHNFQTLEYSYNQQELDETVVAASNFWSGNTSPQLISDLRKCKYCDFAAKCSVPNKDMKSFGASLASFLST